DRCGRDEVDLATLTADQDPVFGEVTVVLQRRVRLCDDETVLFVGGQVVDVVGDLALDCAAVRRLDEPECVDPAVRRERSNEADVRALRSLDRTHPAVVTRVDVANLETSTLTRQTAGAKRRQAGPV